ncbi:MAG: hypothetical protein IJF07_03400 [Lachnospiraceae bacterium]|nr:hypothetical protein [Lachnospiraceae bacterium]
MNYIDLRDYKKLIFVKGMTEEQLISAVNSYEEIASGGTCKVNVKVRYSQIDENWTYMEYVYGESEEFDFDMMNFWHYQNLLLWLEGGSSSRFCFAYKNFTAYEDAFYSYPNTEDECGASVIGVFKEAEFYYEVPGFYLEWWSDEGDCILDAETLYQYRKIDESLLQDIIRRDCKEIEIEVSD